MSECMGCSVHCSGYVKERREKLLHSIVVFGFHYLDTDEKR